MSLSPCLSPILVSITALYMRPLSKHCGVWKKKLTYIVLAILSIWLLDAFFAVSALQYSFTCNVNIFIPHAPAFTHLSPQNSTQCSDINLFFLATDHLVKALAMACEILQSSTSGILSFNRLNYQVYHSKFCPQDNFTSPLSIKANPEWGYKEKFTHFWLLTAECEDVVTNQAHAVLCFNSEQRPQI